ncbi:hypothetical protein [Motilimonas sp. E26]|uniref:hypothetical protein n=1 Tax=Motilimonas sp. E26 TaxID=2865674 RepID=UPI001E547331|nr:hypothetical protein [Motilimonas sp. E26]MCE0557408.1 hypothetical protein [Motilimonas sp. E26]
MRFPDSIVAPDKAIPKPKAQAYKYLSALINNDEVSELDLLIMFKGSQRAPLQKLEGDRHEYWNIIPIKKNGVIVARKLDPRHKSGCPNLDAEARQERKVELREVSRKQAESESKRLPKAIVQYEQAVEEASQLPLSKQAESETKLLPKAIVQYEQAVKEASQLPLI